MGVYQIRNVVNDKVLIGASLNLPGIFNRHKCQLKAGNHQNGALQAEWNEFGGESFAFEILDEITPKEGRDIQEELACLEELWLEKSQPYGDRGYNKRKKGREVLLEGKHGGIRHICFHFVDAKLCFQCTASGQS
jgi:hypothetical protein